MSLWMMTGVTKAIVTQPNIVKTTSGFVAPCKFKKRRLQINRLDFQVDHWVGRIRHQITVSLVLELVTVLSETNHIQIYLHAEGQPGLEDLLCVVYRCTECRHQSNVWREPVSAWSLESCPEPNGGYGCEK